MSIGYPQEEDALALQYATISGIAWRSRVPRVVLRTNLAPFILPRRRVFAVVVSEQNRIGTYESRYGRCVWERHFKNAQDVLTYSHDGKWLAIACLARVFLLDSGNGRTIAEFPFVQCTKKCLGFSSDDSRFVIAGSALTVVFDLRSTSIVKERNFKALWWSAQHESAQACFSPCGHFLASGDRNLSLRCATSGKIRWTTRNLVDSSTMCSLRYLRFAQDGLRLHAIFSNGHTAFIVILIDALSGKIIKSILLDALPTFSVNCERIALYHPTRTAAPSKASILELDSLRAVALLDSCYPGALTFSPIDHSKLFLWTASFNRPTIAKFLDLVPRCRVSKLNHPQVLPDDSIQFHQRSQEHYDLHDKRNYIVAPDSTSSSAKVSRALILDEAPFYNTVFSPDASMVALQIGRYLSLIDASSGQECSRILINPLPYCSKATMAWHPLGLLPSSRFHHHLR